MKKLLSILLAASMLLSFTACNNNAEGSEESEVAEGQQSAEGTSTSYNLNELHQNDYRGGVMRTYVLKDSVLNLMEQMKANNITIRQDNPNSFWTTEGFQDFVVNFLNSTIMNDTQWFNEEETDWDSVKSQMLAVPNSFTVPSDGGYAAKYGGMQIIRNEKHDYTISGISGDVPAVISDWTGTASCSGSYTYQILYDCNRDWCKAYATLNPSEQYIPDFTVQLFEYARLDNNTFVIQTNKERLIVVLKPVEADTEFPNREIKEFYYSKLVANGARSTFQPYVPKPDYDEYGTKSNENVNYNNAFSEFNLVNDKGDLAIQYGANDSIFRKTDLKEQIKPNWVFEETGLQQGIVYKDGVLVVTTYNKIIETYERFIYSMSDAGDSLVKELEGLVDMDKLTGSQPIPSPETETPINKFNTFTPEEMEEFGFSYDDEGNVVDMDGNIVVSVIDGSSQYKGTEATESEQDNTEAETSIVETTESTGDETVPATDAPETGAETTEVAG